MGAGAVRSAHLRFPFHLLLRGMFVHVWFSSHVFFFGTVGLLLSYLHVLCS
jgi:hypothetical protein